MSNAFELYHQTRVILKEKARNNPNYFYYIIVSFLWALAIVIGPVIVLANCFIFNDYLMLVMSGFAFCLVELIFLTRVFYFQCLSQHEIPHMASFHLIDAGIYLVIAILLALILNFF